MTDGNRFESVRYMVSELKPYRTKMILSVICGILKELSIICGVGIAAYMAAMAIQNRVFPLGPWLFSLLCCAVLRGTMTYMESYLSHDVAYHALVDYRLKLYDHFITLCPDILLKKRSGQVATTLMNDVEQLEWFYGHTFGQVFGVTIICIGLTAFMFWLHWSLALALVLSIALIVAVPFIMKGKADEQGMESRFRLGEANSVTLEGINGMNELLTLNWEERYKEKNRKYMEHLTEIQVEYARRMGVEGGLLQAVSGGCAVGISILGAALVLKGELDVSWFAVVGTTVWLAFNPVLTLCLLARNFGNVFAASARVADIMKQKPVVEDCGKEVDTSSIIPEINFEHVSFRYNKEDDAVLDDVSFRISPGEAVALVGESGAGKTTCTSLLNRLWDVESGKISIGGTDVRDMKLKNLHDTMAVVLQDVYLFNESIADNIRLSRPEASLEEVMEAAKMAKVHDFIISLPQGYDTITGERGVQMSGGQRQRIAIARALLKDSPVLVLDEAVSNLDTKTDMEIQETIRNLAHKKTILMVAHRLSTIQVADKLVVLHHGKVVQTGTHDQLLRQDGYYRKLISAQIEKSQKNS